MCKDLGTLSQGYKGFVKGTNNFFFIIHDEIRDIPQNKPVNYARIVVDYWQQKSNPNRVCLMVGVNLLNVPG